MSANETRFGNIREWFGALIVAISLTCAPPAASAEETSSSIADRERIVSIARDLAQNPLNPDLLADRAWAMRWLIDAPDITITMCAAPLNNAAVSNYPYARDILAQYALSMAVKIIENPATENDKVVQQIAGVEGALAAYRSILRDRPDARSAELDKVMAKQSQGELPEFVQAAFARCRAEDSKT